MESAEPAQGASPCADFTATGSREEGAAEASALRVVEQQIARAYRLLDQDDAPGARRLVHAALTGIANRRAFEKALAKQLPLALADARPLSLAMVDVNRFKSINDTHSHQVGNKVLQAVASLLVASVRAQDLAARFAGDEFVVMFVDAERLQAEEVIHRVHAAVDAFDWAAIASGLTVSLSIGVSQAADDDTVESIVRRSDDSMYQLKPGWEPTKL